MYTHILALWWLFLGLTNGARAILAFSLSPVLKMYALSIPWPILGGLYALWSGVFLGLSRYFWRKRTSRWALPIALAYQATTWALRIFAYRSDYARNLWARDLILTGLFLGAVYRLAQHAKREGQVAS